MTGRTGVLASVLVAISARAFGAVPQSVDLAASPARFIGANAFDGLGGTPQEIASAVGDLNADGIIDLIVAAPGFDSAVPARSGCGAVCVFFGPVAPSPTHDLATAAADLTLLGPTDVARAGAALAVADLDADGLADLVVASPGASPPPPEVGNTVGRVDIIFGPLSPGVIDLAAADPARTTLLGGRDRPGGDPRGDEFGTSLAIADVAGSSALDVIAGGPRCDLVTDVNRGCVRVMAGPIPRGLLVDFESTGPTALVLGAVNAGQGERLGVGLAAGDLSGDGRADLAMGGDLIEAGGPPAAGAVSVLFAPLSGTIDLAITSADARLLGGPEPTNIGTELLVSDVSVDGSADLLLGADGVTAPGGRDSAGAVFGFFGPIVSGTVITDVRASADLIVYGEHGSPDPTLYPGDLLGNCVVAADINADGAQDLLLGAPGYGTVGGRPEAGATILIEGPFFPGDVIDLGLGTPDSVIQGGTAYDHVARVVPLDLSGDGSLDLLVAAPGGDALDESRESAGELHVVLGDNRPPVADAGGPYRLSCGTGSIAMIDGRNSSDPDGDALTYAWSTTCPAAVVVDGTLALTELRLLDASRTCDASCSVTLSVQDTHGATAVASSIVQIIDDEPPRVLEAAEPLAILWSPNHSVSCIRPQDLRIEVSDNCTNAAWRVVGCAANQPDDTVGDGHHMRDCVIQADGSLCVRAERQGTVAQGRSYTVLVSAIDACGNETGPLPAGIIFVPHDRRGGSAR